MHLLSLLARAQGTLTHAVFEEAWEAFPGPNPGHASLLDRSGVEHFRTPNGAPGSPGAPPLDTPVELLGTQERVAAAYICARAA